MKKSKITESLEGNYSLKKQGIPKGCELCLIGAKTVLFLNGICQLPNHCSWYCPISIERKQKNQTYANEIHIKNKFELFEEIRKTQARGMSITGGEPLHEQNINKTLEYIRDVKKEFGREFHIHIYTNGINFNEKIAGKLSKMGLDEIRFHPSKNNWKNINYVLDKNILVGCEIPIIPNQTYLHQAEQLILYLNHIGADFINLNEFEFCFPNSEQLKKRGFKLKDNSIASVDHSRNRAIELINHLSPKTDLMFHFCSIKAKDYFQVKNRYLRRAESISASYESITTDGLLLYAQIEGKPSQLLKFYTDKIESYYPPEEYMKREKTILILSLNIALNDGFIETLEEYNLNGYILETLPFHRKKYKQITEKIPIKIFKEDYEIYED